MSDLRELLFFYADSGADEALEDEPVNRLGPKRTAHAQPAEPAGGDRNTAAPSRPAAPERSVPAAPRPPASPDMAAAIP
ncbi:MAG: uracil-DNA glycosylase, partial [Nitratireductor sp.]